MSVSKPALLKEKQRKNAKKSCIESQNVDDVESRHEEGVLAGRSSLKRSLGSKEKHVNNAPKAKKKNFVIPRKNNQAKELLQSQNFDCREVKDLLRHVKLSFRHQYSSSMFKFDKVEFVHNEKLSQKYTEKKQELRLELPKNRELKEEFAFLYTQSRSKTKTICEHGLQTGHCQLNFLGDPKLGIYLCRFADIVYKRPLDTQDSGYLIVFNVIKGRVKGISGGNPEQQPTPHHDSHVSKLFTNLSSTATHGEIYGSSQLYFYEIDENSEDFHAKQPRQVLPYAVLTFSITRPEDPQTLSSSEKPEEKNPVQRNDMPSRTEENNVSSPAPEDELNDNIQSAFNVSWTGQLLYKNKFVAFINLLSYSKKKQLLPDYVEHSLNICKKISQENLKYLYKCPIFRNGKPSCTGVSKEFGSGGKFIYYEIQPVMQERDKYDKLLSYFVKNNAAAVLEYYGGSVHMYIMPTSQLTHDTGITDERSPMILHALVHVKRLRPFPLNQEVQQVCSNDDTSPSEDNIKKQVQAIFEEKYHSKSQKRHSKIPSLLSKKISLDIRKHSDLTRSSSLEESRSRRHESSRSKDKEEERSSSHKPLHRSESWSGRDDHDDRNDDSYRSSTKYKWQNPKLQESSSSSSLDQNSSKNASNSEQLNSVTEEQYSRDETPKSESDQQSSLKEKKIGATVNLAEVQRLIEQFKKQGTSLSVGFSSLSTNTPAVDPRFQSRQTSSINEKRLERTVTSEKSSIPPPPIPPPPPLPISPLVAVISPPLPSTPVESMGSSTPEATPPPTVTTLSTFIPPVQNYKDGPSNTVSTESSSKSSLFSPPAIKRKRMDIPGLEPPGSHVFDLIKDKKVSVINKNNRGNLNDSNSKSHPPSPLVRPADDSKTLTPPILSPQGHTLNEGMTSENTSSGIPDSSPQSLSGFDIQVKPRALTEAEKTASKAMKEVMNILERNAHIQNEKDSCDIPPVGTKTTTAEDFTGKIKSILKPSLKNKEKSKESISLNEQPVDDNVDAVPSSTENISTVKELHKNKLPVKVVSLDEYRSKKLNTGDKRSCPNTPEQKLITNDNCQSSPATPELKSGLDLIDNLISKDKDKIQSSPKTKSQGSSSKQSLDKDKDKRSDKKNTTPGKGEQSSKETKRLPKKRRRIVTIKSKAPEQQSSGWENMTSDISDDELPDDKITSDISDTELPDDFMESDDLRTEINKSRLLSRYEDNGPSSHRKSQYHHEEHERRFHDHRGLQTQSHLDTCEPSRCYKSSSQSSSPDERGRDRKRRRTEMELNSYHKDVHEPLLYDNNTNDSGSAMSISPINSPVSFEYNIPTEGSAMSISPINSPVSFEYAIPTEGTYRSVIASPLRHGNIEVTIPQDNCMGLGSMSVPRSPTEVDMMDSPGTPETAVPAEDFLHANVGYWSSEFTTTKGQMEQDIVPAYGEMGYLETHDDRQYETANQGDIQHSYHQDVSGEGWSTPPPRPYSPCSPTKLTDGNIDDYPTRATEEDHIIRGEGYQLRRCASIGESSGYESPSYLDLRRPFFGTTEDIVPEMYDKNTTCTEDDKYIDRYHSLPSRTNDLCGREQQLYYISRSSYEDIDSPRSANSIDDYNYDRLLTDGRDSPHTPEYMDSKYPLERKFDESYNDCYYRSPSDIDDGFEQRISTYDRELDPYQNEGINYYPDEEPREPCYFSEDEDRYYSPRDQDPQDSNVSKSLIDYVRDYMSDDESLSTSDYYEQESYQYLDDMAKDNISNTTLELDRVVCDGINSFPAHLLNLSNYYTANQKVYDSITGPVESDNKVAEQVSKRIDPRLNPRDPRLNKNNTDATNTVANVDEIKDDPNSQTAGRMEQKDENKAVKPLPRVRSYFYVYNPDKDIECEAVKNYMLKTGAQYLDVSDESKLNSVRGDAIRILIRGKHKSALHKISNLSKLKCLRNIKFGLFNTAEDVIKKTRAYSAVFQYGGVLIPDDFILKRVHPAYIEALLRFMREENILHQKVYWVMNIRYQAYKKLVGSQRPLTWRDTFVLELLRKYRNAGFVNIIQKEYVTEGLSLIQRYLDTAWKQQRDLLTTYRHFIMLSNLDMETSWFRNRGIGFMDIKTFLLAFAGEKKSRQLLSRRTFTEDGQQTNAMNSSSGTISARNTKSLIHSDVESTRHKDLDRNRPAFKTSSSNMVSRSINYTPNNNMKERRLEILSSINHVKDNLLNSMGGSASKEIGTKDVVPINSKGGDTPKDADRRDVTDNRKENNCSKDTTRKSQSKVDTPPKKQVSAPQQKGSTWSRTVRSVNGKDYAMQQRDDGPRRRRESPYQSRTGHNPDHTDRKYVKDRLSSSHPRSSIT